MGFNTLVEVVKADDLTSSDSSPKYSLGAKHHQSGNEFVYVYNAAANSTIASGKYCVLDQNGGTSFTSGYSVTVTNASLAGYMAGVAQSTISTGNYGWVMIKGVSLIALDSGAVSMNAGDLLALGTDGGFVVAAATFTTAPRFGFMINSGITAGTGKGRIFGGCL